jgi:hypothetical protein
VCWSDSGGATVAIGVKMVHLIGIGVQLEQSGLCWSGTGLVIVAPGDKTVHWIGVGVLLE